MRRRRERLRRRDRSPRNGRRSRLWIHDSGSLDVSGNGDGGAAKSRESDGELAKREGLEQPSHEAGVLRRVLREARPYRRHIFVVFLLSLLSTPLALLGPVPLKIAVDSVLGSEPLPGFLQPVVPGFIESSPLRLLYLAVGLQVFAVLVAEIQGNAVSILSTYTSERLSLSFQARLLNHVQRLSFAFHDRRGTADSIYRIQYDAPSVSYLAVSSLIPFVTAAFTLVSMIYIIVAIDSQLALVALAISPLFYVYTQVYRTRMHPKYKEAKRLDSKALAVIQEVLTSFRVVKAFGREQRETERYVARSTDSMRARIRLGIQEGAYGMLLSLTTAAGTATVMFIGVRNVQSNVLTLGELLLVLSYVGQLYGPLRTVSKKVASLQRQLAGAQRAFELLDEVPEVRERPNARGIKRSRGEIEVIGLDFAYEDGTPVLSEVSFHVEPGMKLGIAGPTGAGKTTLVGLLSRFYDPTEGRILLDGIDIRDYKIADLRAQFAIMLQEPVLFSTTIADNIAYARPGCSMDDIVQAARAAGAHDFVSALPDEYETIVGERGMRLSGGERQRISLARAFLKNAPILILDEPTSSVDTVTEEGIMQAMQDLMAGRTTLMIAHRLSTLEGCDALLRIDDGRAQLVGQRGSGTTTSPVSG